MAAHVAAEEYGEAAALRDGIALLQIRRRHTELAMQRDATQVHLKGGAAPAASKATPPPPRAMPQQPPQPPPNLSPPPLPLSTACSRSPV